MNNNHHNLFKKYSYGQIFIICLALVCIFFMVYIYQGRVAILPQEDFRDDDIVEIVNSKTEKSPGDVDKSIFFSLEGSNQQKANDTPDLKAPGMNAIFINGFLMEPINVNYTKNIYFTIKTTHKFHTDRLFPLMLTWLQFVDKNKVSCYYKYYSTAIIITVTLYRTVCSYIQSAGMNVYFPHIWRFYS